MKNKRCSVLILVTALVIIGMRGVCMAQYSQHISIDRSETQEWNDVEVAIPINKSIDSPLTGSLRLSRNVSHLVDEPVRTGFTFRVKRYFYVAPKAFHRITGLRNLHVNLNKSCKSRFAGGYERVSVDLDHDGTGILVTRLKPDANTAKLHIGDRVRMVSFLLESCRIL